MSSENKSTIEIKLPKDLQEAMDRGELEIVLPRDGAPVFFGKDVIEQEIAEKNKKRRMKNFACRVSREV